MRPSIAQTHSPDGMSTSGSQDTQHFSGIRSLTESSDTRQVPHNTPHPDNYDDGLVHNHNWATASHGR